MCSWSCKLLACLIQLIPLSLLLAWFHDSLGLEDALPVSVLSHVCVHGPNDSVRG